MTSDAVLPPVTPETVEAHMRGEHCPVVGCSGCEHQNAEIGHAADHRSDGRYAPAFGHTHSEVS